MKLAVLVDNDGTTLDLKFSVNWRRGLLASYGLTNFETAGKKELHQPITELAIEIQRGI